MVPSLSHESCSCISSFLHSSVMVRVFWEGDTQTELEVQGFGGVMLVEGQRGRCGRATTHTREGEGLRLWYSSGKALTGPWLPRVKDAQRN